MRGLFLKVALPVFLLVALAGVGGWYYVQQFLDSPLKVPGEGMEYTLPQGGSLGTLAYALGEQGVMETPRLLLVFSRLSGRGHTIHAGDYWLDPGLTPRQLLTKLETGDVRYFQVTLVEGWTLSQVRSYLRGQPRLVQVLSGESLTAEQLGVDWARPLEGMFYPDTYRFHSGDTDLIILQQAFHRMQEVLDQEWQKRADGLPYRTPYEALIMASLVEKETGYAPERPLIAGVFLRRLQKQMRLQTDPAVIYGLGDSFDGNLRLRHLRDASNSYNTYRHRGLTPTPIALAGREAIHAALHPAEGTALYFVARGDGSHHFSDTIEEHQRAVRKYQIEQRSKNYSSSPPPGAHSASKTAGEAKKES